MRLLWLLLFGSLFLSGCVEPTTTEAEAYTLSVEPPVNGRVTAQPSLDCPGSCTLELNEVSTVTLTAIPSTGYTVNGWSGACEGQTGSSCTLEANRDLSVGVLFAPENDPATEPEPDVPETAGEVQIHFLDVGQGDSVLLIGTGGQTVLYDGGRWDDDALPYLQALGVEALDLVIASHPDADHIGGLDTVIRAYKPRFYMDNSLGTDTRVYRDLLAAVEEAGSQVLEPTRRTISLGEASLEIIPPPLIESYGRNSNSIGVVLDFGDFEAALTGDAEREQFEWWLENTPEYLREVEVYKSSHHGSKNGDTLESMQTWQPEAVVIGVGEDNPYNHPTEQALSLYRGVGATIYRTDRDGAVVVTARADGGYSVVTEKNVPDAQPVPPSEPSPPPSTRQGARVVCVYYNPPGRDDGNEYVRVEALSEVDVSGWTIEDESGRSFALPSTRASVGEIITVPNLGGAAWNNSGDTASLFDPAGTLIGSHSYAGDREGACE